MARLPGVEAQQRTREFNRAIYRLISGKEGPGGVAAELEIITGIKRECLLKHAQRGEYDTTEDETNQRGLSAEDLKYVGSRYGRSDDPAVKEFVASINNRPRRHPDRENMRVTRQRVNGKLISFSEN